MRIHATDRRLSPAHIQEKWIHDEHGQSSSALLSGVCYNFRLEALASNAILRHMKERNARRIDDWEEQLFTTSTLAWETIP